MKIVAFSDTHGVTSPAVEECDVVCICGDFVPLKMQRNIPQTASWLKKKFIPWCESLPCRKVILISGNHDFYFQATPVMVLDDDASVLDAAQDCIRKSLDLSEKVVYLQDGEYEFEGVKFYGTPWCPDLVNWAFFGESDHLKEMFSRIPNDVDVLMTHAPGAGCCDTELADFGNGVKRYFGCEELADAVRCRNVKRWICGHVHTGNHEWGTLDNECETKVANVSILDERYEKAYDPLVFEV